MRRSPFRAVSAGSRSGLLGLCLLASLVLFASGQAYSAKAEPVVRKAFPTPEAAVAALVQTLEQGGRRELAAVLGDARLVPRETGEDRADVQAFLKSYAARHSLDRSRPGRAFLSVGKDNWVFPVPVVRQGDVWRFDARAGMREIFNRRIGRNELLTIETMKAYVAAQREFAAIQAGRTGKRLFACRFFSAAEQENGLYWRTPAGGGESPLGPLVAQAAREECLAAGVKPVAYNGYFFKILTSQGSHAPGGSHGYMSGGEMALGFACVAYPEKYGHTGVMTFLVNQDGIVYQKDLGKKTAVAAKAMAAYDPDETWEKVEPSPGTPIP